MTDDPAAVIAENARLRAELEAMRAQADPARRMYRASEIGDHDFYRANEAEILRALRDGRVVRDDVPAPADDLQARLRRAAEDAAADEIVAEADRRDADRRARGGGWAW
jgi:hypothetical protein